MNRENLSILFVDDESRILDGLRRRLHEHRASWKMRFATSGEEALATLSDQPADIVVADMRMPKMCGGELLQEVYKRYPETTRMILSGQTDQDDLYRYLGFVHHYLQKPCDPETLCRAIERTHALGVQLDSPRMRLAVNRVTALPPIRSVYQSLREELSSDRADLSRVARLVAQDPAITAKVIQLVSSAFFGLPRRVSDPHDAVVLLGLNTIHSVVVAGHVFEYLGDTGVHSEMITHLWNASIGTGELAARFANDQGSNRDVQKLARLAGVLSMIGRGVLLSSEYAFYDEVFALAAKEQLSLSLAERDTFGATHLEVAMYALGQWGFAESIVDVVAGQLKPSLIPVGPIAEAAASVHLARHVLGGPPGTIDERPPLDEALAVRIDISTLIDRRRVGQ